MILPEDIIGIVRWSNPETGKSVDVVSAFIDCEGIESELRNLLRGSFVSAVIQADASLEQKFGIKADKTLKDLHAPYRDLRCLVYMFRCACAHNPANPVWEVRGDFKDRVFQIKELDIVFNTGNKDGKAAEVVDDLGGWDNAIKLMDYVDKVLAV